MFRIGDPGDIKAVELDPADAELQAGFLHDLLPVLADVISQFRQMQDALRFLRLELGIAGEYHQRVDMLGRYEVQDALDDLQVFVVLPNGILKAGLPAKLDLGPGG